MWIVRLALRRPYTFVVASILIVILGIVSIIRMPTDIFPNIDIPVIAAIWSYTGLSPEDIANRMLSNFERTMTNVVTDIDHIDSVSLTGRGVTKIYLQPDANVASDLAELNAVSQTVVHQMPPGAVPPYVLEYNASTVPILQLGISSDHLNEQQVGDMVNNFIRNGLVTVNGASLPGAYGGKQRGVMVDLNVNALQSKGLSAADVTNAMAAENVILPTGTAKIGTIEYQVETNGSPDTVEELNALPIKNVGGATIYVRDVANVRDGFPPQTNIVRVNGNRAVLQSILKAGDISTLQIISDVKKKLPQIIADLPNKVDVQPLSDQSIFVRASVNGVIREGVIAACLTALMVLLFLGSWRSTLIIATSIPLSILCSIIVLSALGQTINIMTLGGLALAVGILVDDATVEVENINRNFDQGKEITQAILDGASQIAVPAIVATLSICIVFVPMFFLSGVAKYLFVPFAESVVFAMLASYVLSRTLVPTMARFLLVSQTDEERREMGERSRNPFVRLQTKFETGFEGLRGRYHRVLEKAIAHRKPFVLYFLAACVLSFGLLPFVGQDFFPSVDSGELKLHVRAPIGTRIEDTAELCDQVENAIRKIIPPDELISIIDDIGLPNSSINTAYASTGIVGPGDADIQVELASKHRPTIEYQRRLRYDLPKLFPGVMFYQVPVDMITQILNFGLPAPIDVQIVGNKLIPNRQFAESLLNQMKSIPGTVDMRIEQPFNYPKFYIDVNRTKSEQVGLTEANVATDILTSLSGSFQTAPSFWMDPKTGVTYSVTSQTPQHDIGSLQDIENIPLTTPNGSSQILGNLASISRGSEIEEVSRYNITPVVDIYGSVDGRDLGGVARDISSLIKRVEGKLPPGTQIAVRGQIATMQDSYIGLLGGLFFSILLIYFLIVINFQSWLDPFIILMALPAALAGIVWFLFVTGTTLSVPALTGAIMCMGVATSNSILVISFSKERLMEGKTPMEAALEAGITRFRPVIMTALAMIIGMLPMSLGVGEGGEQNAPLGRAVIGGLLFATVATLFFVPVFFSLVHGLREKSQV